MQRWEFAPGKPPLTGVTAAGPEHASLPVSGRFGLTRVIAA